VDWEKLGRRGIGESLTSLIGMVRVELNFGLEPTVVIHPGQVKGFNADELEMESGSDC